MPAVTVAQDIVAPRIGFYGKVPVKGDFVTRRLPRTFIEPWDEWLWGALHVSRERLREDWLPAYLASPVWRFVLGAEVCGGSVVVGLLMPSVDRVGRYFPFTLAVLVPGEPDAAALAASASDWFEHAERLILSALDDAFDVERFDTALGELGLPPHELTGTAAPIGESESANRRFPLTVDAASTLRRHVAVLPRGHGVWWTGGSDAVSPSVLLCRGMPSPRGFAAMLNGQWEGSGWTDSTA